MATSACIDLDQILFKWGEEKLGSGYIVEKIDTSKVKVTQMSVIYQSREDWFMNENLHEEVYDNNQGIPTSWKYVHKFKYPSQATWTLIKGYKSTIFPPTKLALEFPLAQDGQKPIGVLFEGPSPEQQPLTAQVQSEWEAQSQFTVKPFSTTQVCAQLHICKLKGVLFTTDVHFTGQVKIIGQKRKKSKTKLEVTAAIDDAFRSNPSFQIMTGEAGPGSSGPTKRAQFRVEGLCTGDVGLTAGVLLTELQTTV